MFFEKSIYFLTIKHQQPIFYSYIFFFKFFIICLYIGKIETILRKKIYFNNIFNNTCGSFKSL